MVTSLMEPMQCGDERRNAALLDASHPLNGVDYVEYRRDTGESPATLTGIASKSPSSSRRTQHSSRRRSSSTAASGSSGSR